MAPEIETVDLPEPELSPQDKERGRVLFAGDCDFMLGVAGLSQLPDSNLPEIAFAGRSNVGKSSFVNALTGRNTLAKTSNTPGRTQQLNYFNLGNALYMVDMPGYGYAKVSKTQVAEWTALIKDYLRGRPNLRCCFIMVDSRHGLKDSDREIMKMLDVAGVSYRIILTKIDKVKDQKLEWMTKEVQKELKTFAAAYPYILGTSAHKDKGLTEARAIMAKMADYT